MKPSRKIYLIYVLPALVIHELSHIVTMIFFLKKFKVTECTINNTSQHYSVKMSHCILNTFQEFCVSYAPFISMLFFGLYGMTHTWSLILFVYQITAIQVSLPSYDDVENFKETFIENLELKEY